MGKTIAPERAKIGANANDGRGVAPDAKAEKTPATTLRFDGSDQPWGDSSHAPVSLTFRLHRYRSRIIQRQDAAFAVTRLMEQRNGSQEEEQHN